MFQYILLVIPLILAVIDFFGGEPLDKPQKGLKKIKAVGWLYIVLTVFLIGGLWKSIKEDNAYKVEIKTYTKRADSLEAVIKELIIKDAGENRAMHISDSVASKNSLDSLSNQLNRWGYRIVFSFTGKPFIEKTADSIHRFNPSKDFAYFKMVLNRFKQIMKNKRFTITVEAYTFGNSIIFCKELALYLKNHNTYGDGINYMEMQDLDEPQWHNKGEHYVYDSIGGPGGPRVFFEIGNL